MINKGILVKYNEDYSTVWYKTDFYCMRCGCQNVYRDDKSDFYSGYDHICLDCHTSWCSHSDCVTKANTVDIDTIKGSITNG